MRKDVEKNPLDQAEIFSLHKYLAEESNDYAKNSAWTLVFLGEPKKEFLSLAKNICNNLDKLSSDNLENSGALMAVYFLLENYPNELQFIIKKYENSKNQKLKEGIANIVFSIDKIQGLKLWATLCLCGRSVLSLGSIRNEFIS